MTKPHHHFLRSAFLVLLTALSAAGSAWGQAQSVVEETDSLLGRKAQDASAPAGLRIGVADVRSIMVFHPLMQYLVSTQGNSPLLYFLPPGSSDLAKLFDERRLRRLSEVRRELEELAVQRASQQRELLGLQDELNKRLGPAPAAPSKPGGEPAEKRRQEEERYWSRKQELTAKLAGSNERYAALEREIHDPLSKLEEARRVVVERIRREAAEAIAHVASAEKLPLVLNAVTPSPAPDVRAAPEPGTFLGANEFKQFLATRNVTDKVEPTMPLRRLLTQWAGRASALEAVFGAAASRTVLYGGQDITWPAMREVLALYKLPEGQVGLIKAQFEAHPER